MYINPYQSNVKLLNTAFWCTRSNLELKLTHFTVFYVYFLKVLYLLATFEIWLLDISEKLIWTKLLEFTILIQMAKGIKQSRIWPVCCSENKLWFSKQL
jgi:hypothetical protein